MMVEAAVLLQILVYFVETLVIIVTFSHFFLTCAVLLRAARAILLNPSSRRLGECCELNFVDLAM